MKTICVFAIHRTGTNYLGSVMRQFPGVAAFGEIFHPDQVWGLKPVHWRAIARQAGREFAGGDDPEFIRWARAEPLRLVEALQRVARRQEREALYFKVFVHQWTTPLAEVIAGLARDPGFTPVLLQRRCVDVYTSFRKAEAVGAYKHADTTDAPVTLDADAYARWADEARGWYRAVDAALSRAGRPPLRATYADDVDRPADELAAHWSRLLGVTPPDTLDAGSVLARQDRSADLAAKVANHDEFLAALEARGLRDEALDVFLPAGESLGGRPVAHA